MEEATVRDRIREAVRMFPGIHLRGIVRHANVSLALAQYHLKALEEERVVRSVQVGGFHRYFPRESFQELTPKERALLNVLRRPRPLEIVLALLEFGGMQHRELLEAVGGSKPALTYQLEQLMKAGIVERVAKGEERGFHLRDPDAVRRLLARYEPLDEVAARVHDTWEDLFTGRRRAPKG